MEGNMSDIFSGIFGIILFLFAVVLGIVWIILPVTVIGIRNRLDRMIRTLDRIEKSMQTDFSDRSKTSANAPEKEETSQTQIIEKSR
jgi:predicted PurR-regulated permease PerM